MKSFTTKWMLTVSACAIAAGSAAAQSYKAEIPFSFTASGKMMAPGAYQFTLNRTAGTEIVRLNNVDTHDSVMALPSGLSGERKPGTPKLRFACVGSRCALDALWVGGYEGAYLFPHPAARHNETARLAVVDVTPLKAE